jgi:hypothetical protein
MKGKRNALGHKNSLGYRHSEEARIRIAAAAKANWRPLSLKTRAKIALALKGRTMPLETRAKIALSLLGNKNRLGDIVSPETRAKMSASHKARLAKKAL